MDQEAVSVARKKGHETRKRLLGEQVQKELGNRNLSKAREQRYNAQVAKARSREEQRRMMYDMVEFVEGRDTEGARRVAEILAKNKRQKGAPAPKKTSRLNAAARKELRRRERNEQRRYVSFVTPTGKKVTVDLQNHPLLAIYRNGGIDTPRLAAATRFSHLYHMANFGGMKGAGLEPRVDTSGFNVANYGPVDAQQEIMGIKKFLSADDFTIVVAMCGLGINITDVYERGGDDKRMISKLLSRALGHLAVAFEYAEKVPEFKTIRALHILLKELGADAGEHVV